MQTTETTPAVTLDTADLSQISQSDYRALREGRPNDAKKDIAPAPVEETPAADAGADASAEAEAALDDETESTEESKPESKPKKDKIGARFSELTGKIKALETELAASKRGTGRSEAAETKPADAVTLPPDPKDPEPQADKYGDYVAWQKDWMKWQIRQNERQVSANAEHARKASAAKAVHDGFQARITEAKAEHADFETVAMNKDLPVTQVMGDAIKSSELGPSVLYHLGKNPNEAARIAKLDPLAQVRELGKIEAKLEAEKAAKASAAGDEGEEPQTKTPPVSKAPKPIKPLGSGAATSSKPNLDTMTMREYRALREAGKIR